MNRHPFRQLRYPTSPEKIANRTVAEEYLAVTDKVEALYGQPPTPLPAAAQPARHASTAS
jgi:hypothetical protein